MLLKDLIKDLDTVLVQGSTDINIEGIAYDSRKVKEGYVFVCIDGTLADGHNYISDAFNNGARALLTEKRLEVPEDVTVVRIKDTRQGLSFISDVFFGHPSKKFNLIGITGTKGKTTTTYMVKSILEKHGYKTGLVGTLGSMIGKETVYTDRTTPESYDLQFLFSEMVGQNIHSAVMEVSSQGLALHRVGNCDFDIGVFTNISMDHIGPREHHSFEDYLEAKAKLFKMCRKGIINIDSPYAGQIIESAECEILTFGIEKNGDIRASNLETHPDNVEFTLESPWMKGRVKVGIPGKFSVYNALAAIGVCGSMGVDFEDIKNGLEGLRVPGRAETVETGENFTVIIDYAHTPDSLKNILETVRDYAPGRLICLFGCGGDRDRGKRPVMGRISGEIADLSIITSDNPRTEDPKAIVKEIEAGIKETTGEYKVITDRREAITYVLKNARAGDIIVLAGKGHETYQTFRDKTIHFDEREVVREILTGLREGNGN